MDKTYEKRIDMVNTLLGEGFLGVFEFTFDTKQEALDMTERFAKHYDIDYYHDKIEGFFSFDTNDYRTQTIFHGIGYKAKYLEF